MPNRPRDLADRMAARRKTKAADDGFIRETFALPRAEARKRTCEIRDFECHPRGGRLMASASARLSHGDNQDWPVPSKIA